MPLPLALDQLSQPGIMRWAGASRLWVGFWIRRGPRHWPGDYRLCAGEARGGGRFRFHRWIPSCRRSMAAQATWYWAIRSIRGKLSTDERQIQRTRHQIARNIYSKQQTTE